MKKTLHFILFIFINISSASAMSYNLGTEENPLIISISPAEISKKQHESEDYLPLLNTITEKYGIYFKLHQSENYTESLNDFCSGKVHIVSLGVVSFNMVKEKCDYAEPLAVETYSGTSFYYSGIFINRKYKIDSLSQLKDLVDSSESEDMSDINIAFGSQYSTSSFIYPLYMLIYSDINPLENFSKIFIMKSQLNAIKKLAEGEVIVAAVSFQIWKKAIQLGIINPMQYKPIIKSSSIPKPILVMNKKIPRSLKNKLKKSFGFSHTWSNSEKILQIQDKKIDRYDINNLNISQYKSLFKKLNIITFHISKEIIEKFSDKSISKVESSKRLKRKDNDSL